MAGINTWWASIKRLPNWGSDLIALMTPTFGVLSGTLPVVPAIFWDHQEQTAYADRKNGRIGIGSKLLSANPSERINPTASKELTIEMLLGLVVHEAMHFNLSPETIDGLLNAGLPKNKTVFSIANIVEDVYIEAQVGRFDKQYSWMINSSWEYFWPASGINKRIADAWDGVNEQDIEGIIYTMTCWKNQNAEFVFRSDFEENLFEAVMSVRKMHLLSDRKNLIEKIIKMLLSEEGEGQGQQQESKGGQGQSDKKEQQEKGGDSQEENEGEQESGAGEGMESPTFDITGKIMQASKESRMDRWNTIVKPKKMEFADMGSDSKMVYVVRNVARREKFAVKNMKKWDALSKWQKDVGTVRTHRGTPGNYGKLTHPGRLHDDGKIFSKVVKSAPAGRVVEGGVPQTIFLDDFSGSMSGNCWLDGGKLSPKITESLHVVGGAASALVKAGHRVAVYGHTTGSLGGSEVSVVHEIKNFNDGIDAMLERLSTAEKNIGREANADSTAIAAVAKFFKRDGSPMRLFVISDGAPACSMYSGQSGIDKTKEVVDNLRKQGIEVYSMSIDAYAMDPCNQIYGSANNFNVQDPKVADKVIKKVLVKGE